MANEVWITGCGLVSALGEGEVQHWARLADRTSLAAAIDSETFAPFHVYPIRELDLDRYVPKKADQRAMGPLMQYGAYAAGMALEEAGLAGNPDLLGRMHLVAAAPGGERDIALDEQILNARTEDPERLLNEQLSSGLRPTLFLAQLPNLFAGNISIIHGVSGSSRTFMGEEAAGVDAVRIAFERVAAGQGDLFLVGAAFNASRPDMLLLLHPGGVLLTGPTRGLWDRPLGGVCLGSAGAFFVMESRAHAEARGAAALARLAGVEADRCDRAPGAAAAVAARQWARLDGTLAPERAAVLSGACGSGPITREERDFLRAHGAGRGRALPVRGTGIAVGHPLEASFLVNLILAIWCIRRGGLFPPLAPEEPLEAEAQGDIDQVVVTAWGHHRGEGLALVERIG